MTVPDKLAYGHNGHSGHSGHSGHNGHSGNGSRSAIDCTRPVAAPALARLLADSSLSRAALAACGFPVALADASAKGRPLTYVNPSFEAYFGYRAEDVLGRPVITLLFPEAEGAADMFNDAPVRLQMRARCKDGSGAEVAVSIGMVHGVDGLLTHWVLAFADRSEITRMQEELRVLRAIAAAP